MTDREDLIRVVKGLAVVHGRVTLASRKGADYYVDMHRVTLDGVASPLAGRVMSGLVADLDFDVVRELALRADLVVTTMLHTGAATGGRLDTFVMRKEAKSHGLQHRIEGTDVTGRRVLVVEDASTTGGSALTAVEAVHWAGGEVTAMAMAVDYATGAAERAVEASLERRYTIGLEELGL